MIAMTREWIVITTGTMPAKTRTRRKTTMAIAMIAPDVTAMTVPPVIGIEIGTAMTVSRVIVTGITAIEIGMRAIAITGITTMATVTTTMARFTVTMGITAMARFTVTTAITAAIPVIATPALTWDIQTV
jgi:hypothetical protein